MFKRPLNARGEAFVVAQMVLLAGIFGLPLLRPSRRPGGALRFLGTLLMLAGGVLTAWSVRRLGRNLTPVPQPLPDGELVQTGPYALARHPIYGGLLLLAVGWSLRRGHSGALCLSGLLWVLFEFKAHNEEARLAEQYPDYPAYRRRVRKFIPWLY
ncbi:methyltransferase family protein [Deinococcus sp.]|uniref:methyltransferase family protein n=1 Tax=Deinococcus sp. TaxID=47478 RepID=UPI003B5A7713